MSRYYGGSPAQDLAAEFEESAPGGQIKLRVPSGAAELLIPDSATTLHYTLTLHQQHCIVLPFHNHNLRK